jgi:hypothetical protein
VNAETHLVVAVEAVFSGESIAHEVGHWFDWGPTWAREGNAEFLSDLVASRLPGGLSMDRAFQIAEADTAVRCVRANITQIRTLLTLPRAGGVPHICNYYLGNYFMHRLYRILGQSAFGVAWRDLMTQQSEITTELPEQQIYDTLLRYTPQAKVAEFKAFYQEWHGGVRIN